LIFMDRNINHFLIVQEAHEYLVDAAKYEI
jgi:hypothetical protein